MANLNWNKDFFGNDRVGFSNTLTKSEQKKQVELALKLGLKVNTKHVVNIGFSDTPLFKQDNPCII